VAGIDVSKARLDVHASGENRSFANDRNGFRALHGRLRERKVTNVVTGHRPVPPGRAPVALRKGPYRTCRQPAQARRFGEALGFLAKSDRIDAKAPAAFGAAVELPESRPKPAELLALEELSVAREALVDMRTALEARIREFTEKAAVGELKAVLAVTGRRIGRLDVRIVEAIAADPVLARRREILRAFRGSGR